MVSVLRREAINDAWKDSQIEQLEVSREIEIVAARVLLDEINSLRIEAGLPLRSIKHFKDAIKAKL